MVALEPLKMVTAAVAAAGVVEHLVVMVVEQGKIILMVVRQGHREVASMILLR